jgi:Fe-S oxidoreductase
MMGKDSEFQKIYLGIDDEFKRRKVKRVITGCQNCYMTILSNSPDIEVISLWEYIAKAGVPAEAKNKYKIKKDEGSNTNKSEYSFVLHDPCPTRDVDSIHVAVRNNRRFRDRDR